MAESHAASHDDHEPSHSAGVYIRVFAALMVLTIASFVVGSNPITMSRPAVGWALMIAISCMKAMLVISFFMHLLWEANWKYVLTIPASLMSVFLVVMLVPDVMERYKGYSEARERFAAPVEAVHSRFDHGDEPHSTKLGEAPKQEEQSH